MRDQTIEALSDGERDWITSQLGSARRFMEVYSPGTDSDPTNLDELDRAWTAWMETDQADSDAINGIINAVGVAFGQRLVDDGVLEWVIATDLQGSDLAVFGLPERGDVLVYPANFVAKRYERGETEFLRRSYEGISAQIRSLQLAGGPLNPEEAG